MEIFYPLTMALDLLNWINQHPLKNERINWQNYKYRKASL